MNDNTVTELNASDGSVVGTYPAGTKPFGPSFDAITFDGSHIWMTNDSNNAVTELNASHGSLVGTYVMPTGSWPAVIAFDGSHIWVASANNKAVTELDDPEHLEGACRGKELSPPTLTVQEEEAHRVTRSGFALQGDQEGPVSCSDHQVVGLEVDVVPSNTAQFAPPATGGPATKTMAECCRRGSRRAPHGRH